MGNELRVLIEEPPKGKRWVAIAAYWPGLERNGKSESDAIAKLDSYLLRHAAYHVLDHTWEMEDRDQTAL